jgi:hypothetical protein
MGTVLDLRLRQPASGDWTSLERSQLYALVDQLPADPEREVVLGVTDAGDPWLVVISGSDEVELHVARIGGRFVVHRGDEERVSEAPDLWTAAARAGGLGLPERRATVTSLFGDTLPVHALAALEPMTFATRDEVEPARPEAPPPTAAPMAEIVTFADVASEPETRPAPPIEADRQPVLPDEAPQPRSAPLEAPAVAAFPFTVLPPAAAVFADAQLLPEGAPALLPDRLVAAADLGETLIGTTGADTLIGGDGNDSIVGGGAEFGFDVLDGRGGDDSLLLDGSVVALGGRGKDGFVVVSHSNGLSANNLGIVLDFFQSREDRLEFQPGSRVRIVEVTPESDVLSTVRGTGAFKDAPAAPGARISFDLDGDGRADGFVLLANTRGWTADNAGLRPQAPVAPQPPPEEGYAQLFNNTALVGMEARTAAGHGQSPVLTAYQMSPGYFGDPHHGGPGPLRPEDIALPSVELFG